ncbi:MAG: peptidoglycan-binding protein [Saprospirales bacterium]|nr:peptidoglycan-binding protein [Saprospirales bacterium]
MRMLKSIIEQRNVADVLRRKSSEKAAVKELQESLNELGFGAELNYDQYGADGDFGNGTVSAIKAFAEKNGLSTDGESVSNDVAKTLLKRLEIVGPLRILFRLQNDNKIEDTLFKKSPRKSEVEALQLILHHMGFGDHLNWEKFGADGDYGQSTTAAVQAFAKQEGLDTTGEKMSADLVKRILEKYVPFMGPRWANRPVTTQSSSSSSIPKELRKYKLGVYTAGKIKPTEFIEKNIDLLKSVGLTDSTARVLAAVSINEGNLEAVNTWDNSYLTFGMFQWTIGQDAAQGELPAMVNKVKRKNEDVFQKCFGQYGLDISIAHTGNVYGHFKLNGDVVDRPNKKEKLRADEWAAHFWEAGHDPLVQAIQVEHAASRLLTFYWKKIANNSPYLLSDLVTSEYGVALLLDNHVNRPGYVMSCIERAMAQTGLKDPGNWTEEEEQKLLRAYLDIRKIYGKSPMTDAAERGERIEGLVKKGRLSADRHSFAFEDIASKGLFDTGVPTGYNPEDYPDIKWDERDAKE